MQTFSPAFLSYFTPSEWDYLCLDVPDAEKKDLVMRRVCDLGARTLAEPSLKAMASLCMLLHDENSSHWQTSYKKAYYQNFKMELKPRIRQLANPDPYIVTLHPYPGDYEKFAEILFDKAFPKERPTHCPPWLQ